MSIVDGELPVIALASDDAAQGPLAAVGDELAANDKVAQATTLPNVRTGHAFTNPISRIARFYAMVDRTAASRGINPDAPRHLKKVTETV